MADTVPKEEYDELQEKLDELNERHNRSLSLIEYFEKEIHKIVKKREHYEKMYVAFHEKLKDLGYADKKGEVDLDKLLPADEVERLKFFDKKWTD